VNSTDLLRYLHRIGHHGSVAPDLTTLRALHRAHLLAVPYENLDIHLGRTLTLDPADHFRKLVLEERGGWCYEMNGLFATVLDTIGFDVRRVAGAVGRETRGDSVEGNHLVLIVTLDRPWIADVGFGDGFLEPLPLEAGHYRQGFLEYRVEQHGDRWIVRNHEFGGADSFDFTLAPRVMGDFARQCLALQTSPDSGFVQKTVCQRFTSDGIVVLRGAIFRRITEGHVRDHVVATADEYETVLAEQFGIRLPEARELFTRVWDRHLAWTAAIS
jgi:N-hydroxyarylamine O-acetyltransferase